MPEFGFKPAALSTSSSGTLSDKRTHRGTANLAAINTIPLVHLVAAGDRLTQVQYGGRATTSGDTATGTVCLYETNSTGTNEGVPVDVGAITVTSAVETVAWCSTSALNIDLTPWAGKYIKFAVLSDGGKWRRCLISGGASGDMVSNTSGTQTNPFGSLISQSSLYPVYGKIENGGAAISSVNGGNPVIPGQAATWTATGFSPNAATLDGIACLSVSSLGFTPPGYADEANNPRPGNRSLVASEGANTASATVPVGVIPGYKYQTLASVSASLYSVVKDMDADIGDFVVYPDADGNSVTSAGEIETNHEGSQVFWLIKGDTGYGLSYNVLTGPGGELIEVNRSLTAKSLTMSGLTMRSLTARGL